jgi:hypothetical protein
MPVGIDAVVAGAFEESEAYLGKTVDEAQQGLNG